MWLVRRGTCSPAESICQAPGGRSAGVYLTPCVTFCAGFPLNDQLYDMIIRRYSDESGNLDFDNYIGCLVRLDAMCRKLGLKLGVVVDESEPQTDLLA